MKDVKHVYVFRTSHSSLRVRVVKTNLRPPGSFTQKRDTPAMPAYIKASKQQKFMKCG